METISVSNSSEKLMLSMVSRLRRLLRNVLRSTKLPKVINSTDVAKPFHNLHPRCVVGRHQRTEEADQSRCQQGHNQRSRSNLHLGQEKTHGRLFHEGQQQPREAAAKEPTCNRKRHRLAHEKA